ncbi:MAG TPA: ABC transporter substrate-binding protein [Anaerolineaceae bacterium]|nr:ABC transporter substrate-binding protein [Anaerolineaceae bacterium]
MKNRSFLALFSLLIVLSMVLGACQSASATPAATDAPAVDEPAAVEPTAVEAQPETPTEAPAASEPVKITFWHQYDSKNAEMIDQFVKEFNDSHPDIQVEAVIQPSYDEYKTLIQTSMLSKTTPDVASVDLIWVPGIATQDALLPLDDYITNDADFNMDDFYPMLAEYDVMGGKRYAMPMSANNMQLIWNKDLFEKAGLDPEKAPTTWDEMQSMAEQCSNPDEGIVGFEYYTQPTGEGITWQFQVWLWAAGGEFLNADNTAAAFNTPEGLKALTYVSNMLQGHGSVAAPWGAFGDGKACMQLDGSWLFGYRKDASFQWGIAPVPAPEGGTTASNVGGERLIVFKTSQHPEAASEFIKFMTSPEVQMRWDKETGFMPVLKSVGESDEYLTWAQDTEPRMLPFINGMEFAHTRPATPLYNQVSDAFSREIQRAYVGEITPEEALANAETAVNDILKGE